MEVDTISHGVLLGFVTKKNIEILSNVPNKIMSSTLLSNVSEKFVAKANI